MPNPLQILEHVRIASPCPVLWEDMSGDDHVRHCGQCDCRVYNLSTMTAEEGVRILGETEGRLCIQLWRRADGTLITADCPIGLREKLRRFRRKVSTLAASLAAYFVMPGCSPSAPNNYATTSGPSAGTPSAANAPRNSADFRKGFRTGGMVAPCMAEKYRKATQ